MKRRKFPPPPAVRDPAPESSPAGRVAEAPKEPGPEPEAAAATASRLRDDAETLREIARRIRSGTNGQPPAEDPTLPAGERPDRVAVPAFEAALPLNEARLAHELKTPLSAIAAAAEIIRDQRLGPGVAEHYRNYAGDIHASAMHALSVVDRMLGQRSGARGLGPVSDLDANALIESLVRELAPLAERQGASVVPDLAPFLPRVAADATDLRQVVLNLVTNAVRASPAGEKVVIATRRGATGGAVIEVADRGQGMTKAAIARLLNGKEKAAPKPTPSGGLGLGFPLVLNLCREMGAEVTIASTLGRGTKVTLTFGGGRERSPGRGTGP